MRTFHVLIGLLTAAFFATLILWGLVAWIINKHPRTWFYRVLAAGQILLGAQALFGVVLFIVRRGQPWLHYAYGSFPIIVLIVAHRVSRKVEGLEWAVFSIASIFIVGLQVRGLMTG